VHGYFIVRRTKRPYRKLFGLTLAHVSNLSAMLADPRQTLRIMNYDFFLSPTRKLGIIIIIIIILILSADIRHIDFQETPENIFFFSVAYEH